MKRHYPRVTEEDSSFFASPEYIKPYEVDGVLTSPLKFGQSFLLKGPNPKPYCLYHVVLLENVYLFIPGHGIVSFNYIGKIEVLNELRGNKHNLLMIASRLRLPVPGIEGAFVNLHIHGAVSLLKSVVDFDCFVMKTEGLAEEPIPVGYDLFVYDLE